MARLFFIFQDCESGSPSDTNDCSDNHLPSQANGQTTSDLNNNESTDSAQDINKAS